MHTFLDNFHQGGKYSAQIDSHQVELSREHNFTDQKYLSISSLQTDYLNTYRAQVLGEIVKDQTLFRQSAPFVEVLIILQKNIQKDQTGKGKISFGWSFGKQTNGRDTSKMF